MHGLCCRSMAQITHMFHGISVEVTHQLWIALQTTSCKQINGANNQPIQEFLASHGLDLLTADLNKEGFNTTNDLRELKAAAIASSGSQPVQMIQSSTLLCCPLQHTALLFNSTLFVVYLLYNSAHSSIVQFRTPMLFTIMTDHCGRSFAYIRACIPSLSGRDANSLWAIMCSSLRALTPLSPNDEHAWDAPTSSVESSPTEEPAQQPCGDCRVCPFVVAGSDGGCVL